MSCFPDGRSSQTSGWNSDFIANFHNGFGQVTLPPWICSPVVHNCQLKVLEPFSLSHNYLPDRWISVVKVTVANRWLINGSKNEYAVFHAQKSFLLTECQWPPWHWPRPHIISLLDSLGMPSSTSPGKTSSKFRLFGLWVTGIMQTFQNHGWPERKRTQWTICQLFRTPRYCLVSFCSRFPPRFGFKCHVGFTVVLFRFTVPWLYRDGKVEFWSFPRLHFTLQPSCCMGQLQHTRGWVSMETLAGSADAAQGVALLSPAV